MMVVTLLIFLVFLISIMLCHYFAKKRGSNPVYWGVVGAVFGPLAIPFAFMSKPTVKK
jgi:hypothetical protein